MKLVYVLHAFLTVKPTCLDADVLEVKAVRFIIISRNLLGISASNKRLGIGSLSVSGLYKGVVSIYPSS